MDALPRVCCLELRNISKCIICEYIVAAYAHFTNLIMFMFSDALFTLFPYSATIEASPNAPIDPTAPEEAVVICDNLGLCSTTCSEDGTSFNLFDSLDQYDLIIACNDEIQNQILRSLPSPTATSTGDNVTTVGYEHKCRSLSEFLSLNFCGAENNNEITQQTIQDMIDPGMWEKAKPYCAGMWEKAKPYYDASCSTNRGDIFSESMPSDVYSNPRIILNENGAAIPNQSGWPLVEASMLVACAGITRFLLDTLDTQFDTAFAQLLHSHFYRHEHLSTSIEAADDQLRRGSLSITGYFSPKEHERRIVRHFEALRLKLKNSDS